MRASDRESRLTIHQSLWRRLSARLELYFSPAWLSAAGTTDGSGPIRPADRRELGIRVPVRLVAGPRFPHRSLLLPVRANVGITFVQRTAQLWRGLYSTLWGDGLIGGAARLAARPPWNYDWMNAGYLLAAGLSLLFLLGFVIALGNLIRRPSPQWFALLGTIGCSLLASFTCPYGCRLMRR